MANPQFLHLVVLSALPALLLMFLLPPADSELITDPVEIAVTPGETAKIECTYENGTTTDNLRWTVVTIKRDDGGEAEQVERNVVNSTWVEVAQGTLTFLNASFAHAGEYRCHGGADTEHAHSKLIVFEMPNYTDEGLALGGIIVALLAVLLLGLILMERANRRAWRAQNAKKQRQSQRRQSYAKVNFSYLADKYPSANDGRKPARR